jgi:cytochrome c
VDIPGIIFYMKKLSLIITLICLFSCKSKEDKSETSVDETATKISGQELFEGEGNCIACHKPDQKIIGPSLQEIAKIYKDNKASIVLFLQEKSEPIIDPSQYEIMKTNFAITKSMSEKELKALEDYIFSFSK